MEFRKLRADELEARVASVTPKGCSVLIYKDARVDMKVLDETVGAENWQRDHKEVKGVVYCGIGIECMTPDGEYYTAWKWDAGSESNTEAAKGEASDSFKRAGFNWGIGRELYTAPFIWFTKDKINIQERNGKPVCYDKFKVEAIEYEGDSISYLRIANTSTGAIYTSGRSKEGGAETDAPASRSEKEGLLAMINSAGKDAQDFFQSIGLKGIEDLTKEEYVRAFRELNK